RQQDRQPAPALFALKTGEDDDCCADEKDEHQQRLNLRHAVFFEGVEDQANEAGASQQVEERLNAHRAEIPGEATNRAERSGRGVYSGKRALWPLELSQ